MKIDRLISIIMILLDKKRIGAKELADQFEVSKRTIYRDIDAINMAGIPVRSTTGVGGGFEIMPQYKLDKKVFSEDELSAILMALSGLSTAVHKDEFTNALAKVKSFVPEEHARDIALKANQLYIDLTPWMGNKNISPYLELIKTAFKENKLLSFQYVSHNGKKTARIIEPYQLVLKNSEWYCQAYCHHRNDFRLFKLSRMSDLTLEKETFVSRDFPSPQLDFTELTESMQSTITLRIHKSVMDRVLDLCTYDQFAADGNEHYIVHFPFIENDYFYHVLLSFGDKCECLAPKHVRDELKLRIQKLSALYSS